MALKMATIFLKIVSGYLFTTKFDMITIEYKIEATQ